MTSGATWATAKHGPNGIHAGGFNSPRAARCAGRTRAPSAGAQSPRAAAADARARACANPSAAPSSAPLPAVDERASAQARLRAALAADRLEAATIEAAAVVARPDEKWGETPCAFVTLKPGASATAEAIIAFLRESSQPQAQHPWRMLLSEFDGVVGWLVLAWTVVIGSVLWWYYARVSPSLRPHDESAAR